MTYANIKLKTHNEFDSVTSVRAPMAEPLIHEFMQPFVEALALKYPQWEFVECDHRSMWVGDKKCIYVADGFAIMDKREELGKIRVDHWCRAGKRFDIDNDRINAKKQRGRGFKTKHQDKAIKYVAKYFGAKDMTELLEDAEKDAEYVKTNILQNLNSELRLHWRRLDDYAAQYMVENWGGFSDWVSGFATSGTMEAIGKFPQAYTNYEEARKINGLIHDDKTFLVHIVNSDYIVKHKGSVSILESDALPATVRRNLGLLKLVKDRELISNVGIRVSEDTFYVVGENNE